MDYPWYINIEQEIEIEQGDIIPECPIVIPPSVISEGSIAEIEIKIIDSIILSQSCDLVNDRIEIVLVCPFFDLKTFLHNLPQADQGTKARRKRIDQLKKGMLPGYHLLNKSLENHLMDYPVVDFRNVYGVHINSLKSIISKMPHRTRLLPPYREHLSQAFARFFMRVGLPQNILIEGY